MLVLNEALLEEWAELLNAMVYFKEDKSIASKASKSSGNFGKLDTIQNISVIPPRAG